jgi:hypothetical protein
MLRLGLLAELADCLLLKPELQGKFREREEANELVLRENVVELDSATLRGVLEFNQ